MHAVIFADFKRASIQNNIRC